MGPGLSDQPGVGWSLISSAQSGKTKYNQYGLTFVELPQRVVAVEEDDESDEVEDKKADDCPPGGSSLVFADLALHLARGLTPPGPDRVLHHTGPAQSLPHPPRDGEDDRLTQTLQVTISPPHIVSYNIDHTSCIS